MTPQQSTNHPAFERLTDLVDDRVDDAARAQLVAHVGTCDRCGATVRWLEKAVGIMRTTALEDAPDYVVNRAARLLRQQRPHEQPRPGVVRALANLLFDSRRASPDLAFGVRASGGEQRQLVYATAHHELELRMEPVNDRWSLSGQILGPCAGGGAAELTGPRQASSRLSELCEFLLPDLPPGTYSLVLRLVDAEIEIAELPIGV